jgi:GMP synthase (glutamine-hydrolysing)
MPIRGNIKALLIQIREDDRVKKEELESFAKYAQLDIQQFETHNVFEKPIFDKSILSGFDLLFVGGASEASVSDPNKYPFVESIKNLMIDAVNLELPTFASCFGFQAAVLAFGGEILKDTVNFEMGTYPITLTEAGLNDPVYKDTPNGFYAVSVHQEKALTLPKSCELLAFTQECCHSFKVKDKPFWAFQFHPELDKTCLKERLGIYKEKYTEDAEQFQKVLDSIQETVESNNLVKNFVDHFVK